MNYDCIVYNSTTGSCKKYAELIGEALKVPVYAANKVPVYGGKKVILVSWLLAANVVGYKAAADKFQVAAVVAVGMSPASKEQAAFVQKKSAIPEIVPVFSVQGGFHLDKLPTLMRLIMKLKCKSIVATLDKKAAKQALTPAEQATRTMAATGEGEPAAWDVDEIVAWAEANRV